MKQKIKNPFLPKLSSSYVQVICRAHKAKENKNKRKGACKQTFKKSMNPVNFHGNLQECIYSLYSCDPLFWYCFYLCQFFGGGWKLSPFFVIIIMWFASTSYFCSCDLIRKIWWWWFSPFGFFSFVSHCLQFFCTLGENFTIFKENRRRYSDKSKKYSHEKRVVTAFFLLQVDVYTDNFGVHRHEDHTHAWWRQEANKQENGGTCWQTDVE